MPLVTDRNHVLDVYSHAAARGWVLPNFCAENLTTMEAILSAAKDYGDSTGCADVPITVALTNLYSHRSQSRNYTHTRQWDIGLKLFMADLAVLTGPGSPFERLNVLVHLDHVQHDLDEPLLAWDMNPFSSIMYDASAVPFERNIELTRRFVEERGQEIVVEGACDEIVDATGQEVSAMTTPDRAEHYATSTGVDLIVANLGTEHRASAADLKYHGDLARQIKQRIGPKIVLHGCSSVSNDQVSKLFEDGVAKVNIWTALERDSSPALLADMVANAAKVGGPDTARRLADQGLLGSNADLASKSHIDFFTTVHRQSIVFEEMKRIVGEYLALWYV